MSRGGRGGARAAATAGIRAVANALGIARNEMNAFTAIITEAPPLFPPMPHVPQRIKMSDEQQYMVDLKQELLTRFHDSPFYMEQDSKRDVRRYTDKYRDIEKEALIPDWKRLPKELRPRKRHSKTSHPPLKKSRLSRGDGTQVVERLAALEAKEGDAVEVEEHETEDDEEEGHSEAEEANENEDQEAPSDDDYLEEDNDYIHTYFDNGENYGDVGSDDNLDEDGAF
uniref:DNA-directed RNA polymerase III subunit n=1 Tax=Parascaris univalens TaxID=6257 RepID=A0A915B1H6_PARUN